MTKKEIIKSVCKYDFIESIELNDDITVSEALEAMQLYADQQTAEKDTELEDYKQQYNEAVEHINELYIKIKEMEQYISELNYQLSYGK